MIRIAVQYRCNVHSQAKISSPLFAKIFAILPFLVHFRPIVSQQNFLSFVQPFLGGNGQHSPFEPPQPQQQPQAQQPAEPTTGNTNSFGGINQFVELFQNMRTQGSDQGGGDRGENVQQVANMAQKLLATFSNSQGPVDSSAVSPSGGLNQYLNFGRNFGLGSALQTENNRRRRQSSSGGLFTLLEDIGRKAAERRRLHSHSPSRQPPRGAVSHQQQSNAPFVRLTDNFGRNFFQMLDELYEYANMPGVQRPTSPQPLTPPATPPPLNALFPWLPTLPPAPALPSARPASLPSPPIGASSSAALLDDSPQRAEEVKDILNANQLMRAFLKTMSRDANKPLRPMPAFRDGTEAGQNRPLMDQLFESDILLTSRQMKAIVLAEAERKNGQKRRRKRKVITGSSYRWPRGQSIPYSFRESDTKWRQIVLTGLKLWESETCLRFRQSDAFAKDRIEFIRGSGCYSSVGRVGGIQKVSIGYGCEDKGIVSHEVGHSLGFWHEQSRPDRDQYIRLDDHYIMGGTEGNFAKRSDLEIDGMGLPYDLGSVMHYGPNAFTTDWDHITIVTNDKKYQRSIGQRNGPSFIDVKQINRLYCHHTCSGTTAACQNGGYADTNNCQQCKCPPGLGGPNCADVEPSEDAFCGGELRATASVWQYLTHKGSKRCVWRIKGDGNSRVRFILDKVNFGCETTCHSFLEIKHNSDFQQNGFRACCDEKGVEVLSEQDELLLISEPGAQSRDGAFTLRYIADAGSGAPLPKPPPPAWIPGRENRPFRGTNKKAGVIEKFILNAIPRVRDPDKPFESVASILTDYFASSILGVSRRKRK